MARDPTHVGRAPKNILRFCIEYPLHRELGPQQVTTRRVLHAFGLTRRARGIQNKQGMFSTDGDRFTGGGLFVSKLV